MGLHIARTLFSGTLTDFSTRSAVGTTASVGANLATNLRAICTGQEGLIRSDILHIGATSTAPAHDSAGMLRCINKHNAPPIDSPNKNDLQPWFSVRARTDWKKAWRSSSTKLRSGTKARSPGDLP